MKRFWRNQGAQGPSTWPAGGAPDGLDSGLTNVATPCPDGGYLAYTPCHGRAVRVPGDELRANPHGYQAVRCSTCSTLLRVHLLREAPGRPTTATWMI